MYDTPSITATPARRSPQTGAGTVGTPVLVAWADQVAQCLGEPLTGGNRVELLEDGPATFDAMVAAIESARDHVNIESYIFEADGPGERIAKALIERCRHGVRVNLIYDSLGSLATSRAFFERLAKAGVTLCEFHPVRRWAVLMSRALHRRDHRKLMVVDGRIGFIGGVNISPVYRSGSAPAGSAGAAAAVPEADAYAASRDGRTPGWRDLHVRIEGPVVNRLQHLFVSHWQAHAECAMRQARYFPPLQPAGRQRVGVAATDAGRRRNPYWRALLEAIDGARREIVLATAYLVPPRRLLRRLERAARRGVAVDLLLPGVSDSWAALHAGRSHYARLLAAGVRLHERRESMLHAKACVIDGLWSSIGSSNADWRSVLHNAEANLIVLDADFAARLAGVLRGDIAQAVTIDAGRWAARSPWHRLRESAARRLEFLL